MRNALQWRAGSREKVVGRDLMVVGMVADGAAVLKDEGEGTMPLSQGGRKNHGSNHGLWGNSTRSTVQTLEREQTGKKH